MTEIFYEGGFVLARAQTAEEIGRIRDVIEAIRKDPDRHDQLVWGRRPIARRGREIGNTCGTAFCAAGWRAQLDATAGLVDMWWDGDNLLSISPHADSLPEIFHGRPLLGISEYASRRLGLGHEQAELFFSAHNTFADLERMAELFAEKSAHNRAATFDELFEATERGRKFLASLVETAAETADEEDPRAWA